jgi:type VI protein secretion system component VasF
MQLLAPRRVSTYVNDTRSRFPRPNASSLWQVLEARQGCGRDAPSGVAALIAVAALVLLFYLIYVH